MLRTHRRQVGEEIRRSEVLGLEPSCLGSAHVNAPLMHLSEDLYW